MINMLWALIGKVGILQDNMGNVSTYEILR